LPINLRTKRIKKKKQIEDFGIEEKSVKNTKNN
jgi:hypothetical protein